MPNAIILLIGATKPARLGVYNGEGERAEVFTIEAPLTEGLYPAMKSIDERFTIVKLLYVRGPGSFMGLKLSYLFCKSFALARDIPFLAADSFALSGGKPIFSRNGRRFVKKGETIEIESFDAPFAEALLPPKKLDARMFDKQTLPDYILSAA